MGTFHQTYQLQIAPAQPRSFLDIPTRDPKALQLAGFSAIATHAMTNAVLTDIVTVIESNGFFVTPVQGGKPNIAIKPGSTLRIVSSRSTQSIDPVKVVVAIDATELS